MSPNRTRLLFVFLVVAQLFLVAAQARDPRDPGGTSSLLEGGLLRAVAPLARLVDAGGDAIAGARLATRGRRELEDENRELRAEVTELRRERLRWSGLALEAEELARGVDFVAASGFELRAARVVYFDRRSNLRTLLLHVGARGARPDQAVVSEDGLVGRIVRSAGPYAKVQLVTDRAAAVGVVLESARRQGILRGAGPARLEIDYLPRQVEIAVGDRVLTAGIDGVFPRGLPVGVVAEVSPGNEMFHRVEVQPAVDFANLATVYLLEREPVPSELRRESADDAGR